jgi:hypothetical protein
MTDDDRVLVTWIDELSGDLVEVMLTPVPKEIITSYGNKVN